MLRFELEERKPRAPQVLVAIGDGRLEQRCHGGRRRDRVGAAAFGYARLYVGNGFTAVDDRRDAREAGRLDHVHDPRMAARTSRADVTGGPKEGAVWHAA